LDGITVIEKCAQCSKIQSLCVCESIRTVNTQIHVLILQHPQEPDQFLGSARLAHLALPNSTLKIGLSWPNLRSALGKETQGANWAVLYLGSGIKGSQEKSSSSQQNRLQFVSKQGNPVSKPDKIEGLVILDGTWSQAKALWWRNAWLLKLKRAVLQPSRPSLYRELRKEPRRECLSTIESIAEALEALGEPLSTGEELRNLFSRLLEKQRVRQNSRNAKTS
jgi:DTW domain-containing protein YfiP